MTSPDAATTKSTADEVETPEAPSDSYLDKSLTSSPGRIGLDVSEYENCFAQIVDHEHDLAFSGWIALFRENILNNNTQKIFCGSSTEKLVAATDRNDWSESELLLDKTLTPISEECFSIYESLDNDVDDCKTQAADGTDFTAVVPTSVTSENSDDASIARLTCEGLEGVDCIVGINDKRHSLIVCEKNVHNATASPSSPSSCHRLHRLMSTSEQARNHVRSESQPNGHTRENGETEASAYAIPCCNGDDTVADEIIEPKRTLALPDDRVRDAVTQALIRCQAALCAEDQTDGPPKVLQSDRDPRRQSHYTSRAHCTAAVTRRGADRKHAQSESSPPDVAIVETRFGDVTRRGAAAGAAAKAALLAVTQLTGGSSSFPSTVSLNEFEILEIDLRTKCFVSEASYDLNTEEHLGHAIDSDDDASMLRQSPSVTNQSSVVNYVDFNRGRLEGLQESSVSDIGSSAVFDESGTECQFDSDPSNRCQSSNLMGFVDGVPCTTDISNDDAVSKLQPETDDVMITSRSLKVTPDTLTESDAIRTSSIFRRPASGLFSGSTSQDVSKSFQNLVDNLLSSPITDRPPSSPVRRLTVQKTVQETVHEIKKDCSISGRGDTAATGSLRGMMMEFASVNLDGRPLSSFRTSSACVVGRRDTGTKFKLSRLSSCIGRQSSDEDISKRTKKSGLSGR